mmetsp:Transcript_13835/g.13914  ORF Transcript_13835/g.13914 Transcript_13835/m.13914 type:complete len:375 (+) Transcript_13835:171-1295(+)
MAFTQKAQTLAQSIQKNLTSNKTEVKSSTKDSSIERWDPSEIYGDLWEPNENTDSCRDCQKKFTLLLRKHHCRVCAGIYCDDCCIKSDIINTSPISTATTTQVSSSSSEETSRPVRICPCCRRNETPGEIIRKAMKLQLERYRDRSATSSKKSAPTNSVDHMAMNMAIKMGGVFGRNFSEYGKAVPCQLTRGSKYGEDVRLKQKDIVIPSSGYLEVRNKSNEIFCVKVLLGGSYRRFEVPRPSYIAVLPGHTVSCHFDSDPQTAQGLDIIILFNNPHPIAGKDIIYDTFDPSVHPADLSQCARVDLFQNMRFYSCDCAGKNVLLKYKGHGALEPRRGDSITRVGLVGKIEGSRRKKNHLDFDTNIELLAVEFSC